MEHLVEENIDPALLMRRASAAKVLAACGLPVQEIHIAIGNHYGADPSAESVPHTPSDHVIEGSELPDADFERVGFREVTA